MFRISFVYLVITICTLHAKFQKMHACEAAGGAKSWSKMAYLPQPTYRDLFWKFHIYHALLSVMTLHYHRLYQISSLEANFSSEDMK